MLALMQVNGKLFAATWRCGTETRCDTLKRVTSEQELTVREVHTSLIKGSLFLGVAKVILPSPTTRNT